MMSRSLLARVLLEISLLSCMALNWAQDTVGIPADLLAKALNHAAANMMPNQADDAIASLQKGDIQTLYNVAKSMNEHGDHINSVLIWHQLADSSAHHILSMVSLGFTYAEEDKTQAIKYFVQAGEDGPHQAALYNAGRLLAETDQFDRALAYLRRAANLVHDKKDAMYAKPQLTETAAEAYRTLSDQLARVGLSLQQMVDVFPYASMDDHPKEGSREDRLWNEAMRNLRAYFQEGHDKNALTKSREGLQKLQIFKNFSDLQQSLLSGILKKTSEFLGGVDEL